MVRNALSNTSSSKDSIAFREITSGPYAFLWGVAQKGYELANRDTYNLLDSGQSGQYPDPWLVPLGEQQEGLFVTQYAPLSKTTLHREFTELYDDDSILRFANKYGMLGCSSVMLVPAARGEVITDREIVIGESLQHWEDERNEMGGLLAIWDLVLSGDRAAGKLGQFIIWTRHTVQIDMVADYDETQSQWRILKPPTHNIYPDPRPKGPYYSRPRIRFTELITSNNSNSQVFSRWTRGDVIEPAKYYVIREVNKRLEGHLNLKLLLPPKKEDAPSKFYLFPDSLRAALWLMVLMELMGKIRVRQCDICGKWKEVNLTRDTFHCSNACKQAAYRKRKKR